MAAAVRDQLMPQQPAGLLPGAMLAVLAHAALLLALTTVVNWRASAPDAISAELWAAVPQAAAPPAPPPQPAPPPPEARPLPRVEPRPEPAPPPKAAEPDPQIAIAQARIERQKKLAREKAEKEEKAAKERERKEREAEAQRLAQAEAKKREQQAKEKERAEEQRLAQLRQKNLERLMGQVSGTGANSTATAAQAAGPSAAYTGRLIAAIKPNIVFTDTLSGNPAAEVEVRTGPSGSIIARRLLRSSGHKEWDEAVLRAIDRTGTLPRDTDGRVPPTLTMVFRPQE